MTTHSHQEAAYRVAHFLDGRATLPNLDPERIAGVGVVPGEDVRELLTSDLRILCHIAFNTPLIECLECGALQTRRVCNSCFLKTL